MTEIELPPVPPRGYGNEGHSDEAMREYAREAVWLAMQQWMAMVASVQKPRPCGQDPCPPGTGFCTYPGCLKLKAMANNVVPC